MKRWLLILLIALSFVTQFQLQVAVSGGESQYFTSYHQAVNHDIAFGALLPLHSREKRGICGSPKRQEGFLWLHALQYAVEDVNRKWDARRFNASLTLTVCDTCNDEQIALEQALDLAYTYRKKLYGGDDLKPVLGVISSSKNKDASTLLGLFKVPQIIFGKDNNTPDSPGDILQSVSIGYYKARALADLVKYFTWSAVSVVYSTEHQDDFEIFLRISNIEKLCVAVKVLLSGEGTHSVSYEQTIVKLLSEPASTIVILFTVDRETKKILQTVKIVKPTSQFTWIVTNQRDVHCFEGNSEDDTFVIVPHFPFMEGFKDYFENKGDTIEFNSIIEMPVDQSSCSNIGTADSPSKRRKEEIQASMNSIYLLAHAYEKASHAIIGRTTMQLDRVVFSRSLGHVLDVFYSQNWKRFSGQQHMKENIFSLISVKSNGSVKNHVTVGTWDSSWYINGFRIKWRNQTLPKSSCGNQCPPGHIRVLKNDNECCWSCATCHYNQIVKDDYTCVDCLRGYWPNEDFKKCEFQWQRTLFFCTLAVSFVALVFVFMVL